MLSVVFCLFCSIASLFFVFVPLQTGGRGLWKWSAGSKCFAQGLKISTEKIEYNENWLFFFELERFLWGNHTLIKMAAKFCEVSSNFISVIGLKIDHESCSVSARLCFSFSPSSFSLHWYEGVSWVQTPHSLYKYRSSYMLEDRM